MFLRILLIMLYMAGLSTLSGCTLDFVNQGGKVGVSTSQGTHPFYKDDALVRDNPWGDDWQYGRGEFRRSGGGSE